MSKLCALVTVTVLLAAACGADQDPALDVPTTTTTLDGATDPDGEPAVDPAAEWREVAPAPTARQEVATAVVDGRIWVVGGFVDRRAAAVVEVYDPATDTWEDGPDLPVAVHHPMATVYRGELVVLGGWDIDNTPVDAVYALRDGQWVPLPPLSIARAAGAVAAVGDLLVVVGGIGPDGLLAPTDIFDGEVWSLGPDIPTPRDHLAAVAHEGAVYAVGGRERTLERNLAALESFDPVAATWEARPATPTARGGLGAAVHNALLLAVGGEEPGGNNAEVEAFDFETGAWRTLPPMRTPRHGHGVEVVDGTLYALVGGLTPGLDPSPIAEALDLAR